MRPAAPHHLVLALAAALLAAAAAPPARADAVHCLAAIARVERTVPVPAGLLQAVALTESGRAGAGGPWPWTVNQGGDGRFFASQAEAMGWVETLRAEGRRNIDVGCMQVNLHYHPDAFASLATAFEPDANVAYAARFLTALHAETGSWEAAVARYHSDDPHRGRLYQARVLAQWRGKMPTAPLLRVARDAQERRRDASADPLPRTVARTTRRTRFGYAPVLGTSAPRRLASLR